MESTDVVRESADPTTEGITRGPEPEAAARRHLVRRGLFRVLAARSRVRRDLKRLGIQRSATSDAPVWTLVLFLGIAAAAATVGALTHSLSGEGAIGLAAAVLTTAGLLVAVLQWRHGLAEKAFDALYARIALANEMRLNVVKEDDADSDPQAAAKREQLYRFFVYTEIDNLEYAARRYRFGLGMNADIVDRAVRHFRVRCRDPEFRQVAEECAEGGAYFEDTKRAVASILSDADAEAAGST